MSVITSNNHRHPIEQWPLNIVISLNIELV